MEAEKELEIEDALGELLVIGELLFFLSPDCLIRGEVASVVGRMISERAKAIKGNLEL